MKHDLPVPVLLLLLPQSKDCNIPARAIHTPQGFPNESEVQGARKKSFSYSDQANFPFTQERKLKNISEHAGRGQTRK